MTPAAATEDPRLTYDPHGYGGVIRGPLDRRALAFCFTGHEHAESLPEILDALARHHARASFFLTGHFLRTPELAPHVRRLVSDGHYLGPHSDRHLLYCDWTPDRPTLVTREQVVDDLEANLREIDRCGVPRAAVTHYLPSYEHYNREIVAWCAEIGLTLVNYTPGTLSAADWTPLDFPRYRSTDAIFDSIYEYEARDPHGLNGFLLLLHAGAGPGRPDKSSRRLPELLSHLAARSYAFSRVDELLLAP